MKRRYQFEGALLTVTGLHVGSGHGDFTTDARFVRTGDNRLYIPGSSLKGALRSAVERMVASLQSFGPAELRLRSCLLDGESGLGDPNCPTVHKEWQTLFSREREKGLDERTIAHWLYGGGCREFPTVALCDTCQLFGSPYVASKVSVRDLPLRGQTHTEIRHGVGIDRDTGAARPQIKFDYETAPGGVTFDFRLDTEALDDREAGLLCCGLRELEQERVPLGGNSSRGLGRCKLTLAKVTETEPENAAAWLDRLVGATPQDTRGSQLHTGPTVERWMNGMIRGLFGQLGVV